MGSQASLENKHASLKYSFKMRGFFALNNPNLNSCSSFSIIKFHSTNCCIASFICRWMKTLNIFDWCYSLFKFLLFFVRISKKNQCKLITHKPIIKNNISFAAHLIFIFYNITISSKENTMYLRWNFNKISISANSPNFAFSRSII